MEGVTGLYTLFVSLAPPQDSSLQSGKPSEPQPVQDGWHARKWCDSSLEIKASDKHQTRVDFNPHFVQFSDFCVCQVDDFKVGLKKICLKSTLEEVF